MTAGVRSTGLAIAILTATGAAGVVQDGAALGRLESAVTAAPDSLQSANAYRLAVIQAGEYDRALAFFEKLVADHPQSANAWLSYGYAYVDKIPAAGAISQVILANAAILRFGKSIELQRSWLSLYTRGNAYLYWPKIFGRAPLAVADLEEAVELSRRQRLQPYHVRGFIALGDAYWTTDQAEKAQATWREGLQRFGKNPQLERRLALQGDELAAFLAGQRDSAQRVDTDLSLLWGS